MILPDRTSSGYDRLTCSVCGKSLVREPFMGGLRWISEESKFRKKHHKNCKRPLRAEEETK
jgi:hypothetical protein